MKLVYGVGINDADYAVHRYKNGKRVWMCPYYTTWANMLNRACAQAYKMIRPTYEGVTVCEEWHSFMNFRSWMETQDWEDKQLDKDILFHGNKMYSPDTCVFVDGYLNNFLLEATAARGKWPLGVHLCARSEMFISRCNNPLTKKRERLGLFHCPNQAHLAWKKRKHELACQLADMQTDDRVAEALRTRYK